jgi:hypothetical protein
MHEDETTAGTTLDDYQEPGRRADGCWTGALQEKGGGKPQTGGQGSGGYSREDAQKGILGRAVLLPVEHAAAYKAGRLTDPAGSYCESLGRTCAKNQGSCGADLREGP